MELQRRGTMRWFWLAAWLLAAASSSCAGASGSSETAPPPPVIEVATAHPAGDDGQEAAEVVAERPARRSDGKACVAALAFGEPLLSNGSTKSIPKDEQLFRDGVAAERAGDLSRARKRYLELVEKHKRSRFVPVTYLRFGDLFADEGKADPSKYSLAGNFYREVLKYPAPENVVFYYAALRGGMNHQAMGKHTQALGAFKRAAEGEKSQPTAHCMTYLADQARHKIIRSYLKAGHPRRAFHFFRLLSGDTGAKDTNTITMVLQLARHLAALRPPDAVYLIEEALRRGASTSHCRELKALTRQLGSAAAKTRVLVGRLCP